jgi:hypothetical protein
MWFDTKEMYLCICLTFLIYFLSVRVDLYSIWQFSERKEDSSRVGTNYAQDRNRRTYLLDDGLP